MADWGVPSIKSSDKPKPQSIKEMTDKLDVIKTQNFCFGKTLLREWKDKPQTWREYLQNVFVKELVSNIYKKNT